MKSETFKSQSEDQTLELGRQFAKKLTKGSVVALHGELGAGKTQFIKGICEHFHIDEPVTSPTFTLVNEYYGKSNGSHITIFHIDLYRLKKQNEILESGINEYFFDGDAITLVEWGEKAENLLPEKHIMINIDLSPDVTDDRVITIIYPD